jgi:hypothetical protein
MIRQLFRVALLLTAAALVVGCATILERAIPVRREIRGPGRRRRQPAVVANLPQFAVQAGLIGLFAVTGRKVLGLRLTD